MSYIRAGEEKEDENVGRKMINAFRIEAEAQKNHIYDVGSFVSAASDRPPHAAQRLPIAWFGFNVSSSRSLWLLFNSPWRPMGCLWLSFDTKVDTCSSNALKFPHAYNSHSYSIEIRQAKKEKRKKNEKMNDELRRKVELLQN